MSSKMSMASLYCQFINGEIFGRFGSSFCNSSILISNRRPLTSAELRSTSFAKKHGVHRFQYNHGVEL
jgi:hypothetical protein